MKRPTDEEIKVVSDILKLWGMEKGYHTAAVLALVEVEKMRERPKMKKKIDREFLDFIDGIIGSVEANSNEYSHLYQLYTEELKKTWRDNSSGYGVVIGYTDDRPVALSLRTAVVDGHRILFWEATSSVVDYTLIEEWLKLNTPPNKTNATNFHNIFPPKFKDDK